ncbi:MAG TPA: hypothetical protein PKI93_07430 [Alphaproteobacteria bacterium]|nr:hypothetical protein [Alphaproteobacteria bacterium]HNS43711.1 hypothetical protein [Alphaproteobacteria bacterium]
MTNSKKISETTAKFDRAALAPPEGVPWEWNWDTDTQPTIKATDGYRDSGRRLRVEMLRDAEKLLLLVPTARLKDDQGREYRLEDLPALIEELEANPDDIRFLKGRKSSERKLLDHNINQNPARICDYIRCQILISTPQEAAILRNALLADDPPTGIMVKAHKDQFRRPCPEGGHRALKMHWLVQNGEEAMLAEVQIGHKEMEMATGPKQVRDLERHLKTSAHKIGKTAGALSNHMNILAGLCTTLAPALESLRRAMNYDIAKRGGFNTMLDSDINPDLEYKKAMDHYSKTHAREKELHASYIGKWRLPQTGAEEAPHLH